MAITPRTNVDLIQYYETLLPLWAGVPDQIGMTPTQVTDVTTKTTTARSKYEAMLAQRAALTTATNQYHLSLAELKKAGAAAVQTIVSFAKSTDDLGVYGLAGLPLPTTPSPVPPPGIPYAPKASLRSDGAVALTWRCNNPAAATGTIYEVHRRDGMGPMLPVGTSGSRSFVDATVPAGVSAVTYSIVAIRSTSRGEAAEFNVQFGSPAAGGTPAVTLVRKAA